MNRTYGLSLVVAMPITAFASRRSGRRARDVRLKALGRVQLMMRYLLFPVYRINGWLLILRLLAEVSA